MTYLYLFFKQIFKDLEGGAFREGGAFKEGGAFQGGVITMSNNDQKKGLCFQKSSVLAWPKRQARAIQPRQAH